MGCLWEHGNGARFAVAFSGTKDFSYDTFGVFEREPQETITIIAEANIAPFAGTDAFLTKDTIALITIKLVDFLPEIGVAFGETF